MGRSVVLSGRIDARDRAKQRHRHDGRATLDASPFDELWRWLDEAKFADVGPREAMQIDLGGFLARSGHFDIAASERLRQLAMHLEPSIGGAGLMGLGALDRIYEEAVRLSPESSEVWHSRGVTAKFTGEGSQDAKLVERARKIAERALHKAWALDSSDAYIAYSMGLWHYDCRAREAIEWFERAIELDPRHGGAKLYRAHCLHDAKRWDAALSAYELVPLDWFTGRRAWLVDVVLEARAYCRLRSGDREGALREFRQLLDRLTKEPNRGITLLLAYASEVCEGDLSAELGSQWVSLQRQLRSTTGD